MLKHGLIADQKHWQDLIQLSTLNVEEVSAFIINSILVKKKVTDQDPYESGLRKILNFGHTIGHAIESHFLTTENPLLHGEAIFMGMLAEAQLSFLIGYITATELAEIKEGITKFYKPIKMSKDIYPNLLQWLAHDKKNVAKTINFSLLTSLGSCAFDVKVTEEQIIKSLDYIAE